MNAPCVLWGPSGKGEPMTTKVRWLRDLLAVVGLSALGPAVVLSGIDGSPLRTALVAPLVVFLPGYALVAALYPERYRERDGATAAGTRPVSLPSATDPGLPPAARVALSAAASVALVPGVAFFFNFVAPTIRVVPVLVALVGLTFVFAALAMIRRHRVAPENRFSAPSVRGLAAGAGRFVRTHERSYAGSSAFRATSRRDLLLNLAVIAGVLVFAGSVGFAFVSVGGADAADSTAFTEFYLTTRTDGGEYVARDYPRAFGDGADPVYVTIANREGETRTYTVVVELQRVDRTPSGTAVVEERRLDQFGRRVAAGETVRIEHRPATTRTGPDLRVRYLLYVGDPPAEPSADNAYRYVQLWLPGGDRDQDRAPGGTA